MVSTVSYFRCARARMSQKVLRQLKLDLESVGCVCPLVYFCTGPKIESRCISASALPTTSQLASKA